MDSRSPAIFVGDTLGLDFLNSVATPVDVPIDWIDDGEGLLRWLEQAGLVPRKTLAAMRKQALPGELNKVADQARSLREWFRTFVNSHRGKPLASEALNDLEPLNRLLERDEGFSRIVTRKPGEDRKLCLQPMRKWRSPESLLLPIGEALGRFVCTEDFSDVKACEGHACTLMFVDHTRGRRRRWCSMAMCGNRSKQAAHRHRLKQS
ncbi:putative RNA-binding Zn ribbon-like protein [Rhizobium sp. ERR 1071]|uniref:CGNR zinc finger domain-containing protein n=1 Tax=Rhizobium sp. ERR 1071 TaxID=2572677 RepID=UPI00119BFDC1|nr:ABATE domain-containing protein [Rhizobium sp. ERR1071]TWB14249.1 putative RNA-binding Zn ribbon-like protein [Rhizobium sp. ERR1071]